MNKTSNTEGQSLNPQTDTANLAIASVNATREQTAEQADKLSPEQEILFKECESDIEKNLQAAFVFGHRLAQIRDQRLFRAIGYKTFESYCSKRWDFSTTHANRLIKAYLCVKHLEDVKDAEVCVPTKESHVRLICDLKPHEQVAVAQAVYEKFGDRKPSARHFGKIRQKLFPKKVNQSKTEGFSELVVPITTPDAEASPIFDTNLVSFKDIRKKMQDLYNIFTNSTKKQDGLVLIGKIQKDIDLWANWQAKFTNGKAKV